MNKRRILVAFLILIIIGIIFSVSAIIKYFCFDSNEENNGNVDIYNANEKEELVDDSMLDKEELYISSYENHAWGYQENGYVIYYDGAMESYEYRLREDEYKREIVNKAKINEMELEKLIELSGLVDDNFKKEDYGIDDGGVSKKEIYNSKLKKWILLSSSGEIIGENSTIKSQEILNLTQTLYDKYLAN